MATCICRQSFYWFRYKFDKTKNHSIVYSYQLNEEIKIEKNILHPLIKGGDSRGYIFSETELRIIFPYEENKFGKTVLMTKTHLQENFPLVYSYLNENKKLLSGRDNGKMNVTQWFGFSRNQALDVITTPKIFTPDISPYASYAIDISGEIFFTGGVSGGYGIIPKVGLDSFYLLGLLNSKLLDWYLKQVSTQMRGGWYSFESKFIKNLPICTPEKGEKERVAQLIKQVTSMLQLQREKKEATHSEKIDQLHQRIQYTENKINQMVYELYELTEEEIKMVEGGIN